MRLIPFGAWIIILMFLLMSGGALANPVITFFIRPFPEFPEPLTEKKVEELLATPGKISAKALRSIITKGSSPTEGIFATYWGYLGLSNRLGELTLPRKQQKPAVNILITPMIVPIMMLGTIVHHWEVAPHVSAEMYSAERKQDPQTKLFYWEVQETEVPLAKPISLDTITLFAHPEDIYIPTGITVAYDNPNLHLPPIYAKKNISKTAEALRVLTIRHFFAPIKFIGKKEGELYYSRLLKVQ